ncbi:MAG TPA: hypothetical protein VIG80_09290 [Bacillaceae bacterium]
MNRQIKDGINEFIGKEPLMDSHTRDRVLTSLEAGRKSVIKKRGRPFLHAAVIAAAISAFVLIAVSARPPVPKNDAAPLTVAGSLEKDIEGLKTKLMLSEKARTRLDQEILKLQEENGELRTRFNLDEHFYRAGGIMLEKAGFGGTVEDFRAELMKQTDLIPYEGILGGTMGFREENILVLSDKYVYAMIDDGHYMGYMLLTYEIKNGKVAKWTVTETGLN